MAKIKLKSKKKIKLKAKLKSKVKSKPGRAAPKGKLKSKSKLKSKPAKKAKSKTKKRVVKAKKKRVVSTPKKKKTTAKKKLSTVKKVSKSSKKKSRPKLKPVRKEKPVYQLSDIQKAEILITISKIINLHKSDQDGLKSLTSIERILDKYNQKYTNVAEKFDAVVKYGMEENPAIIHKHVFVPTQGKDKETLDLYKLLVDIGQRKIKFNEIERRIDDLYTDALESRQ